MRLVDENGKKMPEPTDVPVIVDVERTYFEKPFWDTPELPPSVLQYMRSTMWNRSPDAPPNSVVSTASHEVFFFEDKKLFQMFCDRIGEENCRDGVSAPDRKDKDKAKYFTVPMKGNGPDVYILAVPHKMDRIKIGHDKEGYAGPFSLRLLMEEVMAQEKDKRPGR